jgi:hypothetical protein
MLSRRVREALTIAALLALISFFFLDILLGGLNLYQRDISHSYYPNAAAVRSILRAGEWPFWNHFAAAGQPLAANPGYEVFYPPQWLLALGPLREMFHFEMVLHYLVTALGMYLLGRSLRLSRVAAAFGGFAWALGGLMLALGNVLLFLHSAAWIPWVALTFHRFVEGGGIRRLAAAALPLAMVFLAADVSMILQTCGLVAAFAIADAIRNRRWKRSIGGSVAAGVIALVIASVQLVPALDHQRDSGRSIPMQANAAYWSMPAARVVELAWPSAFGSASSDGVFLWGNKRLYPHEATPYFLSIYAGIISVVLIAAGFIRRIRGSRFVAAVAGASFLLALGNHGPIFPLLYRLGLQSVRYPEKFFFSAIFILSLFAMIAADAALRDAGVRRAAFYVAGTIAILTTAVLLPASIGDAGTRFANFWQLGMPRPDFLERFRQGMLMTLVFSGLATVLFRLESLSPRLRTGLLAATAVIDLGSHVTSTMPRTAANYYTAPAAAQMLAASGEPVRIYSHADWQRRHTLERIPLALRHWILRNGILPLTEMNWGFEGILDEDIAQTNLLPMIHFDRLFHAVLDHGRSDRTPLLLQMGGISHVTVLKPYDPALVADPTRFDQVDPVAILPTRNAGRLYFADRVIRGFDEYEVGRRLFSNEVLSPRTAFTDVEISPAGGRLISWQQTTNGIEANVETANQAFFVFAVTRHKYWSATVDGSPATLHPTNVAFQGLIVGKGFHHLQLRYRNPLVATFAWISLAALVTTLAVAIAAPRAAASVPAA